MNQVDNLVWGHSATPETEAEVERYCLGLLDLETDRRRMQSHLFGCEPCRREALETLDFLDALRAVCLTRASWN